MSAPPDAAEYFDGRTSYYDSRYDRLDADGHALRARMAAVLAVLGTGPGSVLDAGMGPGRLCAELSDRGWTVSGVDASAGMVAAARARLPDAAARLMRAEIEALPWPDASFDAVTATGVLEYSDVGPALSELARVLRPGGQAVVSYPNPAALYGIWKTRVWYAAIRFVKRLMRRPRHWMPHGAGEVPPAAFVDLLHSVGLELESTTRTSYLPLPSPLDTIFPKAAARLGARLEGCDGRAARRLATQVVYATRKRG